MKSLLLRLSLLFVCLIAFDFFLGNLCDYCIKKAKTGTTQKREYTVNGTSEDILIFGSSRAYHHYVPSILMDSLGLSVYNCGLDSHGIYYAYGCLSMILERYSPKLIIYDIVESADMLEDKFHDDQNINSLYRYCSNVAVSELIHDYSPRESIKLCSHLYKYNESILHIFKDFLFYQSSPQLDGYAPNIGEIEGNPPRPTILDSNVWEEKKKILLGRFIDACKDKEIELVFFYSPKYYGESPMVSKLDVFFKENNCLFVNFADDSTFLHNRHYFCDLNHLNNYGADEYTKQIVQVLKPLINTSSGGKFFDYSLSNNERNGQ